MALWNQYFGDMDPLTFKTIVQLQLGEVEGLSSRAKGKQREGTVTDNQVALQAYVDDVVRSGTVLDDRKVVQCLALAVLSDDAATEDAQRRKEQIARDRELARHLAGNRSASMNRSFLSNIGRMNDDDPLRDLWNFLLDSDSDENDVEDENKDITTAESSAWAASHGAASRDTRRRCVACTEDKESSEVVEVPCRHRHEYCRDCLAQFFRLAIEDESLFPPRCDGDEMSLEPFRSFLPASLIEQFELKSVEFRTTNRAYCHDPTCSAFIPPTAVNEHVGNCPRCYKTTCVLCKGPSHCEDCPTDTALQQLKETANTEQWQQCYLCHRLVQLERGCNHITYVCDL